MAGSSGQPLRILQVCSARNIVYGAVRSMITLSDGLKDEGHIVEYLTFAGRGAGPALRERGETVHEVTVRAKLDPIGIWKMADVIRKRKIQVVHTHLSTSSINGALAARLAGVPSVATVHGLSGKMSFTFANKLVAVSEQVKLHLVGQGMKPEKIKVIYNGVEFPKVAEEDVARLRQELQIGDAFPVVGTVSRVTGLKGISFALEAVAELKERFPNVVYILLGDGDALEACEAQADRLGLKENVRFVGYKFPVEPYLQLMDILAFPSLKEAMGIALVEAAGQGVPIVSTNVGGIPEVVSPDMGILVPPADAAAMSQGLQQLASDDARRGSMSLAGIARANALFSRSAMVSKTESFYRQLIEATPEVEEAVVSSPQIEN